ncbi:MAG: alpha/beta hydrolase [Candidatus Rokubacteria bacterium]|nr:alpha/beta hydrolase [Candidatus Rokubacteria bacterium]
MPTQSVDGITINYLLTGSGPLTLCLVHGSGGSTLAWVRQLEGLADAARVVALDLPGHGDSAGEGSRSIDDYVSVVKAFVQAMRLGRVVLGGHSMGGAIAQATALAHPDLLSGLILVGTGARLRVLPRILELIASNYAEGCAFVNAYAFSPAASEALKEGAKAAILRTRPQVTHGDFTACNAFDVMDRVGNIRLPALVICGRDDRLTPPKYARFLAQRIPGARLVLVDKAGHYVQLEQPEIVNAEIREFLETLTSTLSAGGSPSEPIIRLLA